MARQGWEYLAVPLKDAGDLKKGSDALHPEPLNELGAEGWEAVGCRSSAATWWRGRSSCSSARWIESPSAAPLSSPHNADSGSSALAV